MGNLTKKDQEILDFIKKYMVENGTTPSIREIGDAVHLFSSATVHKHFRRLVDKGYVVQIQNTYRYTVRGMKYHDESGT